MRDRLPTGTTAVLGLVAVLALAATASTRATPLQLGRDSGALVLAGAYQFGGARHRIVSVWHRRADDRRLMAFTLGSPDAQVITGATIDPGGVRFSIDLPRGSVTSRFDFEGRFNGRQLLGQLRGDGGVRGKLQMQVTAGAVVERGLVLVKANDAGEPEDAALDVSAVVDEAGAFLGGRFESHERDSCPAFGCSGQVVDLREAGALLTLQLQSDDACPVTTELRLTFDAVALVYSGSYTRTGCVTDSGRALAARTAGTTGAHATQILQGLGGLADDLEDDAPLRRPHPAFSADYLHSGYTLDDLFARFDEEAARYSARRVSFEPVRRIRTSLDPLAFPGIGRIPLGVVFDERREGVPLGGGPARVYVDSWIRPGPPRLAVWGEEGGRWVIRGNGDAGYDLPFAYTATSRALEVPTPGGTVYVSPGPFGAHTGPLTGHVYGDGKANLIGYLSDGDTEMVDLGNGDGIRDPGEPWGFFGGPDGSRIRQRIPTYTAPADGVLQGIRYLAPDGSYFDNVPHWMVDVGFPDGTTIGFGHLGAIAADLRNRVLDALGIDLWTYTGPEGVVVGHDSGVHLRAGDTVALPQVMARPLAGYPGYYVGPEAGPPSAGMEFGFVAPVLGEERANSCVYEHLPRLAHAAVQRIIDREMTDPAATRYRPLAHQRWLWSAEGRACLAYTVFPTDFRSLDTALGGWFERPTPGVESDEIFAIYDMARDSAAFTPELYDRRNIGQLARRQRRHGLPPFTWLMPDGTVVRPFYPAAEVLARTTSTLLLAWRDIGYRDARGGQRPAYQWASYRLDASGLTVHWGPFLDHPDAGTAPPLSPSTPCTGATVVCYDHTHRPGF